MKKRFFSRQVLAVSTALLVAAVGFVGCDKDDDEMEANYTITSNASGAQMVPSVSGSATGSMTGTYNPNTNTLNYTVGWNGMSGAATSGGFYSGNSGVAGTAVSNGNFTLTPGMTSSNGTMTLTDAQETSMLSNGWYWSMGTNANPNGEIRGQVNATR